MDVFDAVESVKSLLMETFSADRNVCKFDPQTAEDVMAAKSATALANFIFYRENKGTKILHDVIHDALVAKTGIVKRYYKNYYEYDEETFEGLDEASFNALASDPAVTITEYAEDFDLHLCKTHKPAKWYRFSKPCTAVSWFAKLINLRCVSKISHPKTF